MRILLFLTFVLGLSKAVFAAEPVMKKSQIFEPIQATKNKDVVLYHFSPELLSAAADCLPYQEDFTKQNPDLKKISNSFGGTDYKVEVNIQGISDDLCHFTVVASLSGIGKAKTSCAITGEQHLALIKAMKDKSLQPVTVTYVTSNDEKNEFPVQTTLTASHFDTVWEKIKNDACKTEFIEPTEQERLKVKDKMNLLSKSFKSALQKCEPAVEKRLFYNIDNSVEIIGTQEDKCHLFYNNFDILIPISQAAKLKYYDDFNDLLRDNRIATYRDKDKYPSKNMLFELDYCRKHQAGKRSWSSVSYYNQNLKIVQGLVSKYSDETCRLKLIHDIYLDGQKLNYSLFCDIEESIISMVLMSYEDLLAQYGEKTITDKDGNISYTAPQVNEETLSADAQFLQELQRLHLCQPAVKK